jgi:rubrerythrin
MDEATIKKVHALAQLDRDAVAVYDEVLKRVNDSDVTEHFTDFRDEHQHHATELAAAIVRLGGAEFDLKVDAMGVVADWVMGFRAMMGEKGPLHAMHMAESYHNTRYKEAVGWDVGDSDLASQLQTFYAEEQRHLAFVDQKLRAKV